MPSFCPFPKGKYTLLHLWRSFVSGKCQCSPHQLCRVAVQRSACCKTLFSSPKMSNHFLTITEFTCCGQRAQCLFFIFFFLSAMSKLQKILHVPLKSFSNSKFQRLFCSFQRLDISFFSFSPTICSPLHDSVGIEVFAVLLVLVLRVLFLNRVTLPIYRGQAV